MSKNRMSNSKHEGTALELEGEGARRATEASNSRADGGGSRGPLVPGQRWTAARKQEIVLRMLRGESLDSLSRELGVEIYRLEGWRDRALAAMKSGLKSRRSDPLRNELDAAMKRIGELSMDNELLYERCRRSKVGFPKGRSRK